MPRDARGPVSSLTDLFVLMTALALIAGAVAHSAVTSRTQSNRIKCMSNLRQIGQSIQIYANENKGVFPRTYFDATPNPIPTEYTAVNAPDPFAAGGPGPNDVTSGLYLLLRTSDITSDIFVCPTKQGDNGGVTPWQPPPGLTMKSFSNFTSRANLSYGYTNPYPSQAALKLGFKLNYTLSSDFAIAADMGPGPVVATVAATAPRNQIVSANSLNHAGDGQNVLYADGHVDWAPTIFCGAPRPIATVGGQLSDNIYAFGADTNPSAPSTGTHGAPLDQHDSVILPTANIGFQPAPVRNPAWMIAAAVAMVAVLAAAVAVLIVVVKKKSPPGPPPLPWPS